MRDIIFRATQATQVIHDSRLVTLFGEDLRPNTMLHAVDTLSINSPDCINFTGMSRTIKGAFIKIIHNDIISGLKSADHNSKPIIVNEVFVQKGHTCQTYSVFQFLSSVFWDYLDDWAKTLLYSILQSQSSSRKKQIEIPLPDLELRPEIINTYDTYVDKYDKVKLKNATEKYKISDVFKFKLKRLEHEENKYCDTEDVSFTKFLRAMLLNCSHDGTKINVTVGSQKDYVEKREPTHGLYIISVDIEAADKQKCWEEAVEISKQYKEAVAYYVILENPTHCILNSMGWWHDTYTGNPQKDYKDLKHFRIAFVSTVNVIMKDF